MAIGNILCGFGKFYDHLVHFVCIWHILSVFGIMHQEKFDKPVHDRWDWPHGHPEANTFWLLLLNYLVTRAYEEYE
jgi:hypothetical protein